MKAPGKTLLKVTGILLIILGALATLFSLLMIAGGGYAGYALSGAADAESSGGMVIGVLLVVVGIVTLIGGVFDLIAGILGVKYCNRPEKAKVCFVFGVIMLILQAASLLLNLFNGMSSGTSGTSTLISGIVGLVIPLLYLVGAHKNKQVA